ncbi:MAG TPA: DUF4386 family protein [Vicinamibacterales bacterium]|nr:DUF4386 family protein [Vicinamibacterales bacterium]
MRPSLARIAGAFYLLTFITGITALVARGRLAAAAGLAAAACYVVVTLLFYFLFAPVNKPLSLLAAVVSLAGIAAGPLGVTGVNPLVFFGVYCLLIGYLVFTSTFLPRSLGVLMALSSVGWLTYLSPQLGHELYPYNLGPGIVGEGSLTVWLVAFGIKSRDTPIQSDSAARS